MVSTMSPNMCKLCPGLYRVWGEPPDTIYGLVGGNRESYSHDRHTANDFQNSPNGEVQGVSSLAGVWGDPQPPYPAATPVARTLGTTGQPQPAMMSYSSAISSSFSGREGGRDAPTDHPIIAIIPFLTTA